MPIASKDLADTLLSEGRHSFTISEAQTLLGKPEDATRRSIERLAKGNRVFWVGAGLYVIIPPEFRRWGAVPATYFIDDLMDALGRRYYVALLSAAEIHGAAHQAPQVFQVMTDRPVERRDFGRVRLQFVAGAHVSEITPEQQNSSTGAFLVSDRELTVVDLVAFPRYSGGLSNVATILAEFEQLDGAALAHYAAGRPRAIARRLGWLLEQFTTDIDLRALRAVAAPGRGEPAALGAGGRRGGHLDRSWGVRVNTEVEPDL